MLSIPRSDASEIERAIFEQAGILTTPQAVGLIGRRAVRTHLAVGRWRRVCVGILSTHNGPLNTADQHRWTAVLVAGEHAVLAGPTALAAAGVRNIDSDGIYVLVPAPRNRSVLLPTMPPEMPPIHVIRTRMLPAEHIRTGRPPRTTRARAAVDAAVWAPNDGAARVVLAATCQQKWATPEEIFAVLAVRRGLPRLKMIRATMLDIAGGAQALSEINLVALCRRYSLPAPSQQEKRRDRTGRPRFLDAYWKSWRVHAEIDGSHHMEIQHWGADMVRQNNLWIKGDRILRFTAAMIRSEPWSVAEQIRAALKAGGWTPGCGE